MLIKDCLKFGNNYLQKNLIKSASLDAEILLSFSLKKSKEFIYTNPEKTVNNQQLTRFKKIIEQRADGEPVAYIIGKKEFYGLDFYVNKQVLIPRPETEMIVEEIIKQPTTNNQQPTVIIDVGTGSGCIPITICKTQKTNNKTQILAVDVSSKALAIARKNAKFHHVANKIKLLKSDLLKNIPTTRFLLSANSLVITANLPYLTLIQYHANPELKFEPKEALVAGRDGLKYYHQLLKQIKKLMTDLPCRQAGDFQQTANNRKITVILEIDPGQKSSIFFLIKKLLPSAKAEFKKDLGKRTRLVIIKINQ